jgi:hypothetical protein
MREAPMIYVIQINDTVEDQCAFRDKADAVWYVENTIIPKIMKDVPKPTAGFEHPSADRWYLENPFYRIALHEMELR